MVVRVAVDRLSSNQITLISTPYNGSGYLIMTENPEDHTKFYKSKDFSQFKSEEDLKTYFVLINKCSIAFIAISISLIALVMLLKWS